MLRPSQQHPLLPMPNAATTIAGDVNTENIVISIADIQNTFRDANIDKVAFIRHGNTAPSAVNYERRLTDLGRSQSQLAGASFGIQKLYTYYEQAALCSSASRCVETATLFLDSSLELLLEGEHKTENNGNDTIQMPPIQLHSQLYDGTMQPEGSCLFRSIGYAPLREYLENPNEDDANAARSVLGQYANASLNTIWNVVASHPRYGDKSMFKTDSGCLDKTLPLFAHAVCLPSAALGLAAAIGCGSKCTDLVLDTNTEEAEGYCAHIKTASVSLLHLPAE